MPPKRYPNRLLVLCASINDVTAWPFWKFLQMKKIRGVTDMALLAFNSDGGSFEARIDGDKYQLKNYAKVRGYQHDMFESFVHRWHDPGRSYFVYGGHGMGDYVELEQNRVSLQVHELADVFGTRVFEAVLFDACFMANIDCAYHLRHNTRYIGACEGYMWEPDTALDYHVFNTHNASAMSRFKDPLHILRVIQTDYCSKAPRGDFTIIDTTHIAALRQYVQEHVMQRVYDRATFYSLPQRERLQQIAEASIQASISQFGHPGGDTNVINGVGSGTDRPRTAPSSPEVLALSAAGRPTRRQRMLQAIQFEHSLYPSEVDDKQLLDLKSYLTDMLHEEQQLKAWEAAALGPQRRIAAGRRRVRSDALQHGGSSGIAAPSTASSSFAVWKAPPSRALFADRHGRPPAASSAECSPSINGGPAAAHDTQKGATALSPPVLATTPTKAAPPPPSLSTSYKGSAQEGLDLFYQVVVSHIPPKAASIYATQLGGLSFTVHEYSAMSRPAEPWLVGSKRLLKRRAKQFLKNGELSEVVMESPKASASVTSAALVAAVDKVTATAAAVTGASAGKPEPATSAAALPLSPRAHMPSTDQRLRFTSSGNGTDSDSSLSLSLSVPLSTSSTDAYNNSMKTVILDSPQRAASYTSLPNSKERTSAC
ncbi:PUF nine target 1 [Leishmania major strain Friedlin]|uniref:PUF nine target 1 n=1 Tax=Leishmania major TaxID=5664 RepID=Q4QH06_LEIMA|nr:PUF nine target 1 [Leishmania major strain Friedlin]CAG9570207.1 PUF_nine_target_1 [Leishmania major strain Friedlin]CAJ02750.1 PUF nine target 1 [Leishmania major strain Friedlin]|eukprot:XP_001681542.1 PUF nine target 1 [Leishmania major strain Friedlin]